MFTVIGEGLVGSRCARDLRAAGFETQVLPSRLTVNDSAASIGAERVLPNTQVAILAGASAQQFRWADALVNHGVPTVCTADAPSDIDALCSIDSRARDREVPLVVASSAAPGLTTLLAASLIRSMDTTFAVDIAIFGTGGPACARRHHQSFRRRAVEVRGAEPGFRAPGSSRRLVWFPDPIGGADCYFAALADPMVLHRTFPELDRVQARVAATRRDRITARLPMLRRPHDEGLVGGLVVEARGVGDGIVKHRQLAVVMPLASVAAAVASAAAAHVHRGQFIDGVSTVADSADPQALLLEISQTVPIHGFDGSTRSDSSGPVQAARKWRATQ